MNVSVKLSQYKKELKGSILFSFYDLNILIQERFVTSIIIFLDSKSISKGSNFVVFFNNVSKVKQAKNIVNPI